MIMGSNGGVIAFFALAVAVIAVVAVLWRRGLRGRTQQRTRQEDALKYLFDAAYHRRAATLASTAGALGITQDETAVLLTDMEEAGLIAAHADGWTLTEEGRAAALRVVRAHRLWESHLAARTGYVAPEWHRQSERREHELSPEEVDRIAASLDYPRFDPHGDPIPTAEGNMPAQVAHLSLVQLAPETQARVTHLEDEPAILYQELVSSGIHVGMCVDDVAWLDGRLRIRSGGTTFELTAAAASNVSVDVLTEPSRETDADLLRLSDLRPGEIGCVAAISPRCYGAARRRFLDLGILPGTLIRAEMVSPSGDPTAYRVRGALIGLRKEQADMIHMTAVVDLDATDAVKLGAAR